MKLPNRQLDIAKPHSKLGNHGIRILVIARYPQAMSCLLYCGGMGLSKELAYGQLVHSGYYILGPLYSYIA